MVSTLDETMESRRPSDFVKNMVVSWAILATAMAADTYSPDQHLATIAKRLEEVRTKLVATEDGAASKGSVGRLMGQYIGEDRREQAALSSFLRNAKGEQAGLALRVVRVSGMWQAYLSSAVLALDGDPESRDLRDVLDRRLTKLLSSKTVAPRSRSAGG